MYIYICIYIYQCIIYTYISHPLLTVLQFVAMLQIQTKFLLGVFVERWPPHRRHRRGDAKGQYSVTNTMMNSHYSNITNSRISKHHTRKRERRRERGKKDEASRCRHEEATKACVLASTCQCMLNQIKCRSSPVLI